MKSKVVFCVSLLLLVQAVATAKIINVSPNGRPPTYRTIQEGINAASDGDTVEVYPGVYSGHNNVNLDFLKKKITVRSLVNLNDPSLSWNIINSTIIDCGGLPYSDPCGDNGNANRAFRFFRGELRDSKVIGFTIRNGYTRGSKASDGRMLNSGVWQFFPDPRNGGLTTVPWHTSPSIMAAIAAGTDPCTLPPAAIDANSTSGNGYGGAILCENGSSPTISYCVIENCTVTGAHGGRGATGLSGQWFYYTWADFNWADGNTLHKLLDTATLKNTNDGQAGGNGGNGTGTGYGGAIALRSSSSPLISNCNFINNSAQGGRGGDGGRGGNAAGANYDQGLESPGGNAGRSIGSGLGGAIYSELSCNPEITGCTFKGNVAKTGPRGEAGGRGFGNVNAPNNNRVSAGFSSFVSVGANAAAGGAAYFDTGASAVDVTIFTDCNFIGNKAYQAFLIDPLFNNSLYPTYPGGYEEDIAGYSVGGAIFCGNKNLIVIDTCNFINNAGGAIYFGQSCNYLIYNDYANNNGQPGRKNLFQGNTDPDAGVSGTLDPQDFDMGSGAAIYINSGCNGQVTNSVFNQNRALVNGGAIESKSSVNVADCAFSGNVAVGTSDAFTGFGGAIDVYLGSASLSVNATNCSFVGNQSIWGGAISPGMFNGGFANCFFIDNKAQLGGALDLENGTGLVTIADSVFSGNRATVGSGGGIRCLSTSVDIQNCEFFNNSAEGSFASGGGIDIDGAADTDPTIKNCLFADNSSSYYGGAVSCESYVMPQILDCTFSQNTATRFGGSIFADWSSNPTIKDCIIQKSNNHAIHEADAGGNATATYCLFFDNPDGHYYDSGTKLVYYDANINSIPSVPDPNNKVGNPLFLTGTFGEYYLNQASSPAVNTGSASASSIGLDTRTTATNDIGDSGQVDRGYHFSKAADMLKFHLITSVVGGIGTISVSPAPLPDGSYYAGTVVTVTAQPQTGWVVKNWTGTDDDSEVATAQKVVMNSDRNVTVEFKQPTTLVVGLGGYVNITAAMSDANDGDIIVVKAGIYYGPQIQFTKSVELRSEYPDNPAWVAQTIIDFNQLDGRHAGPIIFFPQGTNSGSVLNGFTIRNSRWYTNVGVNGDETGKNGQDGSNGNGGAIWIGPEAGPVIKNCVIRDNAVQGGFGGNGSNADREHNAGRGGWGGWARGGAIYCSERSYPQFINCRILNNQAVGGFGGNGGDWAANGGSANYGGNWSRADWISYDPRDLSAEWVPGDLYVLWTEMAPNIRPPVGGVYYQVNDYYQIQWGYVGDYRWYSGYGGGVFVNRSSNVTFTNCEITGNLAQGGFSGLGGNTPGAGPQRPEPFPAKYEIPAFGGGVYVAAESVVVFNGCAITNNTASNPTFDHRTSAGIGANGGYIPANYDPCNHFSITPYLGHGGGVCVENTAKVTFTGCNFNNNAASMGGGLFGAKAELKASDCDFVSNRAYMGGGMFGQNGSVSINRCQFTSNTAPDDLNDPNVLGEGGGLHFLSAQTNIADSSITNNSSEAIGGGVYFGGEGSALLRNCLLVGNSTGQMGGAIAATTFAQLEVANCTITNNAANLGGGLSSSEGGFVDVVNTILWNNTAGLGAAGGQIAVSGSSTPAGMQVRYSDVQGGKTGVAKDPNAVLIWEDTSNINVNPLFVNSASLNYRLSQIAAGQLVNSPCVDAGSADVNDPAVKLGGYTTRTDGVVDMNTVDLGYHYPPSIILTEFQQHLTVEVIGGHGTVTVLPTSADGNYPRGTPVTLTATPDPGYRVDQWTGTDNDNASTGTNTVTMNEDKIVRVTFSLPQTRTVPGDFTTIQAAVSAARSGDIVIVASGVYNTPNLVIDKEITVASTNPDDPCVVAMTVIDGNGIASIGVNFGANTNERTVFDGITIANCGYGRPQTADGASPGGNGTDGLVSNGAGIIVSPGGSPKIKNSVIRNCNITGGNAGKGADADATTRAGHGGWGGWARGAGVYVYGFANPTFENCTIINCSVTGGNGGNGGNFAANGGDAGYGGNWSDGTLWRTWGYENDYKWYSGYGGGVFCAANSSANFIGCNITNNIARGGMSGIGGNRDTGIQIPPPGTSYRIPSYGGGVYCGENSDVNFKDCTIRGNVTPKPDTTYHTDPYLGHGGGIAFENTTNIRLENCTIRDNISAVGGGVFWSGGGPEVRDCNLLNNVAYVGGGIYATESSGQIKGCTLRSNFAGTSPNDVDVIAGQGGGIFGSSISADIVDCFLADNISSASGGGIHIYGPAAIDTIIKNCLLVGNQAGRDGGGISTNWGAVVSVDNCTLYNNQATGTFGIPGNTGFGGGLYCSYGASTDIRNSIFWDNNGLFGNEIAEATGFEGTQLCGTVSISYCDIRGGQTSASVYIGAGCPSNWGIGNINVDPRFVNAVGDDFHLQHITAGQSVNSPCIDAGGDLAVSLGMFRYSTSTLGTPDTGIVDLGYHYPIAEYCRRWDLFVDNLIDFRDFAVFALAWVDDLGYGLEDLSMFTDCWLVEMDKDVTAPTPNPMTWAIPPHALTGNSVGMRASTASDSSGDVNYQFEDVNGTPSAWQPDPCYIATGLNPTGEYCFRVRARDKYNNMTAWSEPACVTDIGDVNAPGLPTFVPVAAQNIARTDPNTASGQFEWDATNYQWDWWHRVIVDVAGVTDNITPRNGIEVRFICSDSKFSSDNIIPAAFRPIRIGFPVAIGGRVVQNGFVASGSYRLTWNGTNQIVYEVYVDASGGSYGRQLDWHVCVYDASGNAACTGAHLIPQ